MWSCTDLAHDSGHEKLYFFTHHKKFKKGPKIDRQVPGGYWKKTGADVADQVKDGQATVTRTSLAHYTNDQKKTGWLMKEYKLPESQPSKNQDDDEESEKVGYIVRILNCFYDVSSLQLCDHNLCYQYMIYLLCLCLFLNAGVSMDTLCCLL